MDAVGKVIREERLKKKLSFRTLEEKTKIKKDFLEAIEKENWNTLPALTVVTGFVKSIAHALGIGEGRLTALLRRDYPPRKVNINPKPDVSDKFVWSPKLTFLLGTAVVTTLILGYLIFQYIKFLAPPSLEISSPAEGIVVETNKVTVSGKTDTDAVIKVNNQPVIVDQNGTFTAEIEIYQGTESVVIEAVSRAGKITVVKRKIVPKI